jgi:hypothetical protein
MHDDRDVGGRVTQGAVTEEVEHQKWALQATQGAIADDCMDAGDRATQGAIADDCMDAGDRATQGAIAE